MLDEEADRLNLSNADMSELALHFLMSVGGGTPEDFVAWLSSLDSDDVDDILYG